jgi:hypothetical protein
MRDPQVYVVMCTVKPDRAQAASKVWNDAGYKMVVFQDAGTTAFTNNPTLTGPYNGVWKATNLLSRFALQLGADICVFAGDDMTPDPTKTAEQIGREYLERYPTGIGVMQPCADPQGKDETGKPAAARIAGSAWYGKEWIQRAYKGDGPTDGRYWHFYGDESLSRVAEKQNLMWWRPDLIQHHAHWSWGWTPRQDYHAKNQNHWLADQQVFRQSESAGFPEGALL